MVTGMPDYVKNVLAALEKSGFEAWCVGGCVRDRMLGRTPEDWDVATNARPEETLALFGECAFPTGLRHGTVTVRTEQGSVEVTTYRLDGTYQDHRRPDSVTFSDSLEEDLRRRDFTINAMALNLRGELRDVFHGQEDLKAGVVRCVGKPDERFEEDALRMMRGLRFAAVLGFRIERETGESIHRNKPLLQKIAVERIQTELLKMLCGKGAEYVLRKYPDVIGVFWPEVLPMVGFDQRNKHHCYDVWEHTLHAVSAIEPDSILRCAILLHDIGKPETFSVDENGVGHFYGHSAVSRAHADTMLRRLKCSTEFREAVVQLVDWHDRNIPRTEKSIRRALNQLGEQGLRRLISIKRADNLAQAPAYHNRQSELDEAEKIMKKILEESSCFSLKQMAVNGKDLTDMGFSGREVGDTLNALLEQVLDEKTVNDRARLLRMARAIRDEKSEPVRALWDVYHDEIPEFLYELSEIEEVARLKNIGMNCGCEYTGFPRFAGIRPYSRFDHSMGVALIVWHFTQDKAQAAAGLFHDIATPVFAHVVDFLHGDHLQQESTEARTEACLAASEGIRKWLAKNGLTLADVSNYHRYPIADNDAPALSADRLEYTLGNLLNYHFCDLGQIREFYQDLTVGQNECGIPELMFRTSETAESFARAALKNSHVYVADEDRYAMQTLAELLRLALDREALVYDDLWTTEADVISRLQADPVCESLWQRFCRLSRIYSRVQVCPEESDWICVNAKKRWIDPMLSGKSRVSVWSAPFRCELEKFRDLDFSVWLRAE